MTHTEQDGTSACQPPYRRTFMNSLAVLCAERESTSLGLLLIDIRHFSRFNAVFGYATGDRLLQAIECRLRDAGLANACVGRVGNDEFAVALARLRDPLFITLAANKVVRILADPFPVDGQVYRVDVNVGLDVAQTPDAAPERLFKYAEISLQHARKAGTTLIPYGDDAELAEHDWQFETELLRAVDDQTLTLFYQPKIDLMTGEPCMAEALARWEHPQRGLVSPAQFIPLLEQTGAIREFTKWSLHTVLRQMQEWPQRFAPYNVSVNVTPAVLDDPDFPEVVASALSIWNADPGCLTLEVTEGALVHEDQTSYQSLVRLKGMGVTISIDDFGTGYSCLAYFKRIPAHELKIDRSFIMHLVSDVQDADLVQVMIDLGRRFGMVIVAEGIEDQATYQQLVEMGCHAIQGFYVARPMSPSDYCQWLMACDPAQYRGIVTSRQFPGLT